MNGSFAAAPRNAFNLAELSGAFGDLGTLVPFVAAYLVIVHMDPAGVLIAFGTASIVVGSLFRTPFPVQPMKAIGAAAIAGAAASPDVVVAAGLLTGIVWLLLAATGLAKRIAALIPRPALVGVVLGLGFSLMLEGVRLMASSPWLAAALLVAALLMLARPRVPAMLLLLLAGAAISLLSTPALLDELGRIEPRLRLPDFAWPTLSWQAVEIGLLALALPQLPLTFGNALVAIVRENNNLFPDRPVRERTVALSTGLMNLLSSAIGGIPMCHGAGGMAGHVRFGARTGGAPVMLGTVLLLLGLFFADSVGLLLRLFPAAVLGVILFLAGAQLALGSRDQEGQKVERFVVLATAVLAMWHVGIALVFGVLAYHAWHRGWLHL